MYLPVYVENMQLPPRVDIQIDIISFSLFMYMTYIQSLLTVFTAQLTASEYP